MLSFVIRKINRYLAYRADKTTREDFYYSKIYFKRIASFYNSFNVKKQDGLVITTKETISPLGLEFGSTVKQATQRFRKASFIYNNRLKENNHKAVLIKHTISDIKMLVQLQFFHDKLFFIGLDISGSINRQEEKTEIINTVIRKYINQPYKKGDEYPVIQDETENFIIINDDINFSICYVAGNTPQVRKYIMEHDQNSLKQATTKDRESLFYAF